MRFEPRRITLCDHGKAEQSPYGLAKEGMDMPIEIRVPKIESAAYIGRWFKRVGDPVTQNEPLVEIEIGLGKLELPAPVYGRAVRSSY